jgi:uncharacterized membrane protein
MQFILAATLSLHVLASMFWAGTSFTLARLGGAGGEKLFRPQMGAAVIVVLTGGYLWHLAHEGSFGTTEQLLAAGALCAIIAAGVQGAIGGRAIRALRNGAIGEVDAHDKIATAQRIAAVLLAIAAICMGAARYL